MAGLTDVHLVFIWEDEFFVAHTDEERATGEDLKECPTHQWLLSQAKAPVEVGVYVMRQPGMFTQIPTGPDDGP